MYRIPASCSMHEIHINKLCECNGFMRTYKCFSGYLAEVKGLKYWNKLSMMEISLHVQDT